MGGVYGDMLLAWTEQQQIIEVFDMEPLVNGGWEPVVDDVTGDLITVKTIGVLQNTRGGGIADSNGNLVRHERHELWTHDLGLDGKFFKRGGKVYRLSVPDWSDWTAEGGFCRYGIEEVEGNNGFESDAAAWNVGADSVGR